MTEQATEQQWENDIREMTKVLGLVDDCPPCNIPGGIAGLVELAEKGNTGIDVAPLLEELPKDTPMEEWLARMRGVVALCDTEKGDCYTPQVVLEAVERKIEQTGGLDEEGGSGPADGEDVFSNGDVEEDLFSL